MSTNYKTEKILITFPEREFFSRKSDPLTRNKKCQNQYATKINELLIKKMFTFTRKFIKRKCKFQQRISDHR